MISSKCKSYTITKYFSSLLVLFFTGRPKGIISMNETVLESQTTKTYFSGGFLRKTACENISNFACGFPKEPYVQIMNF